MLRGAIMNPERLVDHTPTVFIRIDSTTKLPKKCWEGEVYKITRRTEKVWFEFSLDREVLCPQGHGGDGLIRLIQKIAGQRTSTRVMSRDV
jgi:hypothetical protein